MDTSPTIFNAANGEFRGCDNGKYIVSLNHIVPATANYEDLSSASTDYGTCAYPNTANPNGYLDCYLESVEQVATGVSLVTPGAIS